MIPTQLQHALGAIGPVVLGMALLVAVRLMEDRRDPTATDPLRLGLRVAGWVLIVVGVLAATVLSLGILFSILLLILGLPALFEHQRAQRQAFLGMLSAAVRQRMPLSPALEAFAAEHGGITSWQAQALTRLLAGGWPLPDALDHVRWLVKGRDLVLIRAGQESGHLEQALRDVTARYELEDPVWSHNGGRIGYLVVVTGWAWVIGTFLMRIIAPQMQTIFQEFNLDLPLVTQWAIFLSEGAARYWYLIAFNILLLAMLAYLLCALRGMGSISLPVPVFDGVIVRLHSGTILEALALAVQGERPLRDALASLARWYPKYWVRARLVKVLRDLDAGGDWTDSLLARGVIGRSERAVLQAAQRTGNLAWALREMADASRRRVAYRLQVLVSLLYPPAILSIAAVVGLFVVAYFYPLVRLIESLT